MNLQESVKLHTGTKLFVVFVLLVLSIFWLFDNSKSSTINKVKSGEYHLVCDIRDKGFVKIDPTMIIDIVDGTWIFENGYSKNCKMFKAEKEM